MAEFEEDNEQRVQKARADAMVAEARAKEEAAKRKIRDEKSKSRAKRAAAVWKMPKAAKIALAVAAAVVVFAAVAILPGVLTSNKGVTVSEASLREAVSISKLSTAEFTYEGIAEKTRDNGDVEYHIYYKAMATSGIDMSKIGFAIDEATKTVTPALPPITVDNPVIDESSLDYLPGNASIDLREVLDICKADMQSEASQNTDLLKTAESNLRSTIEALLMPILGSNGYSISWDESAYDLVKGEADETD